MEVQCYYTLSRVILFDTLKFVIEIAFVWEVCCVCVKYANIVTPNRSHMTLLTHFSCAIPEV